MSESVRYKCGHTASKTESFLPWHKCPACHKADDGAAKRNQEACLPALEGSDKQKRWAEGIRDKAYRTLIKFLLEVDGVEIPELKPMMAKVRAAIGEILNQTEAKWWIDREKENWREFAVQSALG